MNNAQNALILLIEDDLQTRRFLKTSLGSHGWRSIAAENGFAGVAMVKNEHP